MSDNTDLVSKVYEDLLQVLVLEPHHEKDLKRRGYSDDEITQTNIKTLPRATKNIVDKLSSKWGDELRFVPGFFKMNGQNWAINASTCMVIPIMSPHGEVSGIKISPDKEGVKKYFLLTSAKATGSSNDTCGTPAKPEPHYPTFLPDEQKDGVLRITEGEHKANLATLNSDVYTISVPGVQFWKKTLPYIRDAKPNKILISFDSDKSDSQATSIDTDEDFKVGKELSKLYHALKNEGFNVFIEDWDAKHGKGIDDVLINGNESEISELDQEDAEKFCAEKLSSEIEAEWVYILKTKSFLNTNTGLELDKEQFDDYMGSRTEAKGKPSTNFINDPSNPQFVKAIYVPKFPSVVEFEGHPCYNTWRDQNISPVEGDCQPFLDHINYLLPKKQESDILLDFLAFQVQQQGKKMSWAIILQGKHGTGKSYLGILLGLLLGEKNVGLPSNEAIKERYTGWQLNKSVILIEELMCTGRIDLANKLKPMISQGTATIRQMRREEYTVPNTYNILAFTNHKDALHIEDGERRYCPFFSPAEPRGRDYYDQLFDWTNENYAKILHFLLERDISNFNAKGRAPRTDAISEMTDLSMAPHEEFIRDSILDSEVPFKTDIVCTRDVTAYINKRFGKTFTTRSIANVISKHGGEAIGQVRLNNNTRKSLTAVRDVESWKKSEPDIIKKAYLDGTETIDEFSADAIEGRRQMF